MEKCYRVEKKRECEEESHNNEMSLMVECEDCKEKFMLTAGETNGQLTHKKVFEVDGRTIFLTYYDCPKCGRRHFAQIDDVTSLKILKEVKGMFAKLSVKRKEGKIIPEKQSARFKKARKHLSNYRTNLMKRYTGKLIHDNETESDFELRFSV